MTSRHWISALALSSAFLATWAQACGLRDNGATMTDPVTGIDIQVCSLGQTWTGKECAGNPSKFTFDQAVARYGQGEWRLISQQEAMSIKARASCGKLRYVDKWDEGSWTSTLRVELPTESWVMDFGSGNISNRLSSLVARVQLVRARQSLGGAAASGNNPQSPITSSQTQRNQTDNRNSSDNTPEQQMTQQAAAQARETQAKGDADAKKQGRRRHDPAMEAHECININAGPNPINSCNYKVNVIACVTEPRQTQNMMNNNEMFVCGGKSGGLWNPRPGGAIYGIYPRTAGMVHWFACKDPADPMEVTFDGTQLVGRCRVLFAD